MSLLTLNHDTLQYLCTFLHGQDALNLSLTCRTLFDVAIPRVPVRIHCRTPPRLCLLWHFATSNLEQAARIRSLIIDAETFEIGNVPFRHRVCAQYCEFLGDILDTVRNLIHLRIDLSVILAQDCRMGSIIASMHNLVHLELNQFPKEAIGVLRNLQSPVESLHVDFRDTYVPLPPAEEFFAAILELKSLRALSIISPKPWGHVQLAPPASAHAYLRSLVYSVPLCVPDCILELCPRLETLVLCSTGTSVSGWLTRAPIPPLRHLVLTLSNLHFLVRLGLLTRVRYIHLYSDKAITPDSDELSRLAQCLQAVQPLGLHFRASFKSRCSPWSGPVQQMVPALRCLSIGILPDLDPFTMEKDRCAAFVDWLENTPSCLARFSLICLRIHIPYLTRIQCPFPKRTLSASGEDGEVSPATAANMDAAHAFREAVRTLPQRLAESSTTLRYVSLSAAHPTSMENCRDEIYDCHDVPEPAYWWRIGDRCDDRGSKTLTPITREEGLRVWRAVLDANDDDAVADIIRRSAL
ncbi:hypothetical protein C8T65DRAFT_651936 [Cerioporus squamosus]|nr:hypothetical protein C8T65DRAFT_651936 [Cerioporus squamosus]